MVDKVSVTAKIQATLEITWNHSFGENAQAVDIYNTAARECKQGLTNALDKAGVRYKIIGDVEPMMVILPVSKPKV